MTLQIGQPAPDLELRDQHGATVTLSSYRGSKAVVLMFYPFAFSGVCTGELCEVRDSQPTFESDDVQLLRSPLPTPVFALRAFADRDGLTFPAALGLLAARRGRAAVRRLQRRPGLRERATFIVDRDGVLRWSVHNQMPQARDLQEQVKVLDGLVGAAGIEPATTSL